MIFDIHAHLSGPSGVGGNFLCPPSRQSRLLRLFLNRSKLYARGKGGDTESLVSRWVRESRIDRVVLLALDGAYREDGSFDQEHTRIMTGNDYVADFVSGNSRLLFGASVHPNRKDAIEELDRVVERGACLIKWIPSAQNIVPDDSRCYPFYERMRYHNIPLLTHTGIEHTLPMFDNRLNDPERLIPALRQGVTVIAAHCGTRLYLHERCRFGQWANLAKEYPNFYGDLSAFGLPLHGGPLRGILRDPDLTSKILFGSDFPALALPLWYIGRIGLRRAMGLTRIENPFDKAFLTLKELDVPEQIFNRAERLLRLPPVSESSHVMKGTAN